MLLPWPVGVNNASAMLEPSRPPQRASRGRSYSESHIIDANSICELRFSQFHEGKCNKSIASLTFRPLKPAASVVRNEFKNPV
jgi:hypothetical protein